MTDCKPEGAGSILDVIGNVFALIHQLPKKNIKDSFQEALKVFQERLKLEPYLRGST